MKAYILYIDREKSKAYAQDALESCRNFGIEPMMVQGVCDIPSETLAKEYGLRFRSYNVQYSNEYACTIGHYEIWKKIAQSNEPGIVLEHDGIIVSKNIHKIKVNDNEILFLGPRVFNRNDYAYPAGEEIANIAIDKFQGTHAYAITPNTAKKLIECCDNDQKLFPVDGILGLRNPYSLVLKLVDPPVAVAEVGDRGSFTNARSIVANPTENFINVEYNHQHLPGFLKGLKPTGKKGYDFTVDWFGGHIPHWEKSLEMTKKNKAGPLSILEVGSYEGRSSTWIADNLLNHEKSMMRCCDTFEGSVEHGAMYPDLSGLKDRFLYNISQSKNRKKIFVEPCTSNFLFAMMNVYNHPPFDIIYIDGSHETEQVLWDAINAYKFLKDDGVLIFDDYEWTYEGIPTVKNALHKFEEILPVKPILSGWQRTYVKGK